MKEQEFPVFPDKKRHSSDFDRITRWIMEGQKITSEYSMAQDREGTWIPAPEFPDKPIGLALLSDLHYGGLETDYPMLQRHLNVIENTPNLYVAFNGDLADLFTPFIHPSGLMNQPLNPEIASRTISERVIELDRKSKVAFIGAGNHDDFVRDSSGFDFYSVLMSNVKAPVFMRGGRMNMIHGDNYRMVFNHRFWGSSKINITNSPKRLLQYGGGGTCEIGWVGHTHQSAYEIFDLGGREQIAIVSGTYKQKDTWGQSKGLYWEPGMPGMTLMMWPEQKHMEMFKNVDMAAGFLEAMTA